MSENKDTNTDNIGMEKDTTEYSEEYDKFFNQIITDRNTTLEDIEITDDVVREFINLTDKNPSSFIGTNTEYSRKWLNNFHLRIVKDPILDDFINSLTPEKLQEKPYLADYKTLKEDIQNESNSAPYLKSIGINSFEDLQNMITKDSRDKISRKGINYLYLAMLKKGYARYINPHTKTTSGRIGLETCLIR